MSYSSKEMKRYNHLHGEIEATYHESSWKVRAWYIWKLPWVKRKEYA